MPGTLLHASDSRVFLLSYGAGPRRAPIYEGLWRAGAPSWSQGKLTVVYKPDPQRYRHFLVAGKVQGEPGLPSLSLDAYFSSDLSDFIRITAAQCDNDLHIHFGACANPENFNGGWSKIVVIEGARATDYSSKEYGALQPSEDAQIVETLKVEGDLLYEIKKLAFAEKAGVNINDNVIGIVFCDSPQCGSCGVASDGCQVVFAVTDSSQGSPGLLATVVWSNDGGETWTDSVVSSLAANQAPTGLKCVGDNLIVISSGAAALEYAALADIVANAATWAQVTTGFVGGKGPTAIDSVSATATYLCGLGGYLYFTTDPTSGVVVLDPGTATTQNLRAINVFDENTVLAVGDSNAVVFTNDAGLVFETITGPAPGVNLTSCFIKSALEWWVGTATGRLFNTIDGGLTWVEKKFPGSGTGKVGDVKFVSINVGYLAHATTTPKGRILRTIDGGFSWYVLPESGGGVMPSNQGFNQLAVCPNVNVVFAGGLASNGTDGIIVAGR